MSVGVRVKEADLRSGKGRNSVGVRVKEADLRSGKGRNSVGVRGWVDKSADGQVDVEVVGG